MQVTQAKRQQTATGNKSKEKNKAKGKYFSHRTFSGSRRAGGQTRTPADGHGLFRPTREVGMTFLLRAREAAFVGAKQRPCVRRVGAVIRCSKLANRGISQPRVSLSFYLSRSLSLTFVPSSHVSSSECRDNKYPVSHTIRPRSKAPPLSFPLRPNEAHTVLLINRCITPNTSGSVLPLTALQFAAIGAVLGARRVIDSDCDSLCKHPYSPLTIGDMPPLPHPPATPRLAYCSPGIHLSEPSLLLDAMPARQHLY